LVTHRRRPTERRTDRRKQQRAITSPAQRGKRGYPARRRHCGVLAGPARAVLFLHAPHARNLSFLRDFSPPRPTSRDAGARWARAPPLSLKAPWWLRDPARQIGDRPCPVTHLITAPSTLISCAHALVCRSRSAVMGALKQQRYASGVLCALPCPGRSETRTAISPSSLPVNCSPSFVDCSAPALRVVDGRSASPQTSPETESPYPPTALLARAAGHLSLAGTRVFARSLAHLLTCSLAHLLTCSWTIPSNRLRFLPAAVRQSFRKTAWTPTWKAPVCVTLRKYASVEQRVPYYYTC
jgi:hypothetical protein